MTTLAANRNYRFLFSATAVSNLGDGVGALAFPWLATLLTRDPVLIAFVAFATHLPWFLFAMPVGVLVDRSDRRHLIVMADLFRLLVSLGVIALIATSLPQGAAPAGSDALVPILALAGLAFFLGTAEVVRDNAAQTLLPSVVQGKQLETANGQLWSIEQIMGSFVGPPLAGVLIAWAVPGPFLLNACVFGLSAWLIWLVALPPRVAVPPRGLWVEMMEGWRYLRGHATLFRLAVMLGIMNLIHMMVTTVLVLYAQEVLGLGPTGHGLLLTAGAAGGVLGGLAGPWIIRKLTPTRSLHLALWMMPLAFALMAIAPGPWLTALALFIEMLAALIWNITTVSYRQREIPGALLGRVNATYRFFGWGMMPVGALLGGALVDVAAPEVGRLMALRLPFACAAFGGTGMAFYGLMRLRLQRM